MKPQPKFKYMRRLREFFKMLTGFKTPVEAVIDEFEDFQDTPWGKSERACKVTRLREAAAKKHPRLYAVVKLLGIEP
jgi:hypothetical protein